MTPKIGFILLTHNKPKQVFRLISILNRMFENPPISCHHDFSKSQLSKEGLSDNVVLVEPHIKTGWGKFAVVDATLRALRLMYERPNSPDWFVLLSGADYPIKSAAQILEDLDSSVHDVHMKHTPIGHAIFNNIWEKRCFERYCVLKFEAHVPGKELRSSQSKVVTLRDPLLIQQFIPFTDKFHCFAGEHWFSANRKAANHLIDFYKTKPALAAHYQRLELLSRNSIVPEESYYQTIFCNAPNLKVSKQNWRYVNWSPSKNSTHPQTITIDDLPKLKASPAHFARKFDIEQESSILDALDSILL